MSHRTLSGRHLFPWVAPSVGGVPLANVKGFGMTMPSTISTMGATPTNIHGPAVTMATKDTGGAVTYQHKITGTLGGNLQSAASLLAGFRIVYNEMQLTPLVQLSDTLATYLGDAAHTLGGSSIRDWIERLLSPSDNTCGMLATSYAQTGWQNTNRSAYFGARVRLGPHGYIRFQLPPAQMMLANESLDGTTIGAESPAVGTLVPALVAFPVTSAGVPVYQPAVETTLPVAMVRPDALDVQTPSLPVVKGMCSIWLRSDATGSTSDLIDGVAFTDDDTGVSEIHLGALPRSFDGWHNAAGDPVTYEGDYEIWFMYVIRFSTLASSHNTFSLVSVLGWNEQQTTYAGFGSDSALRPWLTAEAGVATVPEMNVDTADIDFAQPVPYDGWGSTHV